MGEEGAETVAAFDGGGEVGDGGGERELSTQGKRDELADLGGREFGFREEVGEFGEGALQRREQVRPK